MMPDVLPAGADALQARCEAFRPPSGRHAPGHQIPGGPAPGCHTTETPDEPFAAAAAYLRRGEVVAIDDGGFARLACDATNPRAVAALRAATANSERPTLMARDVTAIRRYCDVSREEENALRSARAPVVLLRARPDGPLAAAFVPGIADGPDMLGFALPETAADRALLRHLDRPLAMAARPPADERGQSDLPAALACRLLTGCASAGEPVAASIVRIMDNEPRLLRRSRGYTPAPIALPPGFDDSPDLLVLGSERAATFCLVKDGLAILSPHLGDLGDPAAFAGYRKTLAFYARLFNHTPAAIAADRHPGYRSSRLARTMRQRSVLVWHHHAHIASCLCENGYPLDAPKVLGIVLDGSGWGPAAGGSTGGPCRGPIRTATKGTLCGGEFLLADYRGFERLAALRPVPVLGYGDPASDLYAHAEAAGGWEAFADSPMHATLAARPRRMWDALLADPLRAPLSSSCGRLIDAVAAAAGLAPAGLSRPGVAASRLEAAAAGVEWERGGYSFGWTGAGSRMLDPAPMWRALAGDLRAGVPPEVIAARFHIGLAAAVTETAVRLARIAGFRTVALSGDCFHNRLLFEQTTRRLTAAGFVVLTHAKVPAGDGGLSLGQAAVAAAWLLPARRAVTADETASHLAALHRDWSVTARQHDPRRFT